MSSDQLRHAIAWGIVRGFTYMLCILVGLFIVVAFIAWGANDYIHGQDASARSSYNRPVGADYLHPGR
jgi:hypothetical protein